jgi:hypothetical protein
MWDPGSVDAELDSTGNPNIIRVVMLSEAKHLLLLTVPQNLQ